MNPLQKSTLNLFEYMDNNGKPFKTISDKHLQDNLYKPTTKPLQAYQKPYTNLYTSIQQQKHRKKQWEQIKNTSTLNSLKPVENNEDHKKQ